MNSIAAISLALLKGEILTIKTAFEKFGVSNLPREVGRGIERKFDVRVSKVKMTGKSKYGVECWWYQYRLNRSDPANQEGIKAMTEYVKLHLQKAEDAITDKQALLYRQQELFINSL